MKCHLKFENHCCWCFERTEQRTKPQLPTLEERKHKQKLTRTWHLLVLYSFPHQSSSQRGCCLWRYGSGQWRGRCSATSWSIRHGHLSALISVADLSAIAVTQLCTRWRWWFCSPHSFKVFRIALKPWTFTARSRSILLWFRLTVEAVASAKKKKHCLLLIHKF